MSFISRFPKRWFGVGGDKRLLSNICRRVTIPPSVRDNASLFMPYIIEDGERPDQISSRLYGSTDYWWLILLTNNIINPDLEWPLPEHLLDEQIENDFDTPDAVMHYVDVDGDIMDVRSIRYSDVLPLEVFDILEVFDSLEVYSRTEYKEESDIISLYGLIPVTYREHYEAVNNMKRVIKLIDPDYIRTFDEYLEIALDE